MAQSSTIKIAEEYLAASAKFYPAGMLHVVVDAIAMGQECDMFARAMQIRYTRACNYPLNRAIIEMYQQVAATQRMVAKAAADIAPLTERLHAQELWRLRHPRTGEVMWDTSRNRG